MKINTVKIQAIKLRQRGKTYSEIQQLIGKTIPKSTLSFWCKEVKLPGLYKIKLKNLSTKNLQYARAVAQKTQRRKRQEYFKKITKDNQHLIKKLTNKDTAKLLLTAFYLAEGGKKTKGALMFGNSDPAIIKIFLKLLRLVYKIDESKFRCTLQCRADQNIKILEKFWSKTTGIPKNKFYSARIDKRSIGKKTKKQDYKGVCKIDYFSAHIFHELITIGNLICK